MKIYALSNIDGGERANASAPARAKLPFLKQKRLFNKQYRSYSIVNLALVFDTSAEASASVDCNCALEYDRRPSITSKFWWTALVVSQAGRQSDEAASASACVSYWIDLN